MGRLGKTRGKWVLANIAYRLVSALTIASLLLSPMGDVLPLPAVHAELAAAETGTPTPAPTWTPTAAGTATATVSPAGSPTATAANTASPTRAATTAASATTAVSPSPIGRPGLVPAGSATATPTPGTTATPAGSATATMAPTGLVTPSTTAAATATPTATVTATPTATPTVETGPVQALEPIDSPVQLAPKGPEGKLIRADAGGAAYSEDGRASVNVERGGLDGDARMSIERVPAYTNPSSRRLIGGVYDFRAANPSSRARMTKFPRGLTISLTYRLEELQGTPESSLSIYYWNESASSWEEVPSKVDRKGHVLTARVNHFSQYSIQGKYVDPNEPSFGIVPNGGFENSSYTLVGGPENSRFDTPAYYTLLTNGDFETGDLSGWTIASGTGGVGFGGYNNSHYGFIKSSSTLDSAPFVVPSDAQTINFHARDTGFTPYFRLIRVSDGATLQNLNIENNGSWKYYSVNVSAYRGVQLKAEFYAESLVGEIDIDDVEIATNVPGWEFPSNYVAISSANPAYSGSGPYAAIDGGGSITSSAFVVPSDAQTIRFWAYNSNFDSYINLLRASDNTLLRQVNINDHGVWTQFALNVSAYRGDTIKVQFTSGWTEPELRVDQIEFVREIPGWESSSDHVAISSANPAYSGSGPYTAIDGGGSIASSAFVVPSDASTIRFWAYNTSFDSYATLLQASDNTALWQTNINDNGRWTQFALSVSAYRGKAIKIQFSSGYLVSELRVDQVEFDSSGSLLGRNEQCTTCGQPVNMTIGNMTHTWDDLAIPGRGLGLSLSRSYNSMGLTSGPFGKRWTFNYGMSLLFNGDGSIFVVHPDGRQVIYTPNADGSYARPLGVHEVLAKNADGTYTLTDKAQTRFNFGSDGKLTSVVDRNGNTVSLSYSDSLLSSVTDPSNRSLTFSYTGSLVSQVTDPAGRTYRYTYDSTGNLVTYTDPMGGTITYEYGPYGMIRATDQNGHVIMDNGYDARGRIVEQLDALANLTTFSYDVANRTTTFTDQLGHTHVTVFDSSGRTVRSVDELGNAEVYTYDPAGNRDSVTDRNGNTTRYAHDSMGNVTSATNPLGAVESWTYDARNNPLTHTDALGGVTHFDYDAAGNLTSTTDPLSGVTAMAYDTHGQLTSSTDATVRTTSYGYDANGNQTSVTDPAGKTTAHTFDAAGRMTAETDPLNHTTTFAYRADGKLTSTTDALGRSTTYAYDAAGNRTSVTDVAGHTTLYAYDEENRLTSVTDARGGVVSYSYDKLGNKVGQKDQLGRTTTYEYDARNKLVSETTPAGTTRYEYDAVGNRTAVIDPTGNRTVSGYDAANRLTSTTDPLGKVTRYGYDAAGNRTSVTDATGRTVTYVYDALSRLVEERDALSHANLYGYDAAGRKTSSTDPNGNATSYAYDQAGRLSTVTDAEGGVVSYEYDAAGNKTAMVDAGGHRTAYGYDELNRLKSETDPEGRVTTTAYDDLASRVTVTRLDGTSVVKQADELGRTASITCPDQTVSYAYDAASQLQTMTDATGTTSYGYDDAGRVTSVASPQGTVGYGYDAAGRRTRIDYPGSRSVTYAFDAAGRMATVTDCAGKQVSYGYDDAGRKTSQTNPNRTSTGYGYDTTGRLTAITHLGPGGTTIASFGYEPDAAGNSLSATEQMSMLPGGTTTYSYDRVNRLKSATYPDTTWSRYQYDPMGNRTELDDQNGATTYAYDKSDRLLSTSGQQALTFSWDTRGNETAKGTSSFGYDAANHLTSANTGANTATYVYNGDGVRVGETVNGTTTTYLQDVVGGLPRVLMETTGGSQTFYVYGLGLAFQVNPDGSHRYYHSDALGSTRVVTDDSGNPVSAYNYDAYGAVRQSAGEGRAFTYTGEQLDTETSLVFLRARTYDPQTGRFLSRDSIIPDPTSSQGINRYSYAQGNPLRYTDPSGHFVWAALLAVGGALTAYDIGSSLNTIYLDPNATPEQRTEAWENLGTYVTAFQAAGPVGEIGGATQGSLRTAGKLAGALRFIFEHGDVETNALAKSAQCRIAIDVPAGELTGQWHHVVSNKAFTQLAKHPTLSGMFDRESLRVQAADLSSHRGYQAWHRSYDDEVVDWLAENPSATVNEFQTHLRDIYSRIEMRQRFPSAAESIDTALESRK